MAIGGVGGSHGPLGIPLHYQPHAGDWLEVWQTKKIEKKGDDLVLHGPLGVGVLEDGTITIDAKGKATAHAPMYAASGKKLDKAELDTFKKQLAEDLAGASGKRAKDLQGALDRLNGAHPAPAPGTHVFANARFGEIKRDVKGGLSVGFGFGVDQVGTIYATKGGKLSWETHIVPRKAGKPEPMSDADRAALAAKIRPMALTMTPPDKLWTDLLNDAIKP